MLLGLLFVGMVGVAAGYWLGHWRGWWQSHIDTLGVLADVTNHLPQRDVPNGDVEALRAVTRQLPLYSLFRRARVTK